MGFFSGLDVEAYDRQYSDRQLIARMGHYFAPYARLMVGIGWASLLTAPAGGAPAPPPALSAMWSKLFASPASRRPPPTIFPSTTRTPPPRWSRASAPTPASS